MVRSLGNLCASKCTDARARKSGERERERMCVSAIDNVCESAIDRECVRECNRERKKSCESAIECVCERDKEKTENV